MNIYIYDSTIQDTITIAKWHRSNGDKVSIFKDMIHLIKHANEDSNIVNFVLFNYIMSEWQEVEHEILILKAMHIPSLPLTTTKYIALNRKYVPNCDVGELNGVITAMHDHKLYIEQFTQLSSNDLNFQYTWLKKVAGDLLHSTNNVVRIY